MKRGAVLLVVLSVVFGLGGCHRGSSNGDGDNAATPGHQLPPLRLTDHSKHLLLTWIDKKGDFHVVQKPSEVPSQGRQAVRVVVTDKRAGTGQWVYVANLTKKRADGTYPVSSMTRAAWNNKGASLRKTRMEALAPSAAPAGSVASAGPPGTAPSAKGHAGLVAIIYGAEWCNPCHEAARYLRERGVKVIHKDIENDETARREMEDKLAAAHIQTSSIPVIDLEGRLLVGFSPTAINRALAAARGSQTL